MRSIVSGIRLTRCVPRSRRGGNRQARAVERNEAFVKQEHHPLARDIEPQRAFARPGVDLRHSDDVSDMS